MINYTINEIIHLVLILYEKEKTLLLLNLKVE